MWCEELESFSHTHAPGMTVLALREVNAQIHVILLAQFKPNTAAAAWQEVLGSKRLIAPGYYLSQAAESRKTEPFG